MRDRLIELIESARYWGSNTSEEIADRLLANGVIVPPICVGGIAYVVPTAQNRLEEITEMRCIGYIIGESGMNANLLDGKNKLFQPSFDSFEKTVFLTLEEAEKVLANWKMADRKDGVF